jgi:serine phosphatase RsbU (regulator of sigma subunit)
MPLRGVIGGDHILYLDFNQRYDLDARIQKAQAENRAEIAEKLRGNKRRAGVLVADVSGHRATDSVIAAMLHQSFLLGTYYELDMFGEITTRLFEHLNTRFFKTVSVNKYFTMIYGEIRDDGRFRFLTAGHQPPMVFSREFARFVTLSPELVVGFPPVGMFPSTEDPERRHPTLSGYKRRYTINEINLLSPGDVLLLYTDGFSEHAEGEFFPAEVERILVEASSESAEATCRRLRDRILHHGTPSDDVSFVVIRKH